MSDRDCEHGQLARSCDTCRYKRERDELRAALLDYGTHQSDCDYITGGWCNCGWDDIAMALEAGDDN